MLRPTDEDYLKRTGLEYEVTLEAGLISLVIKAWPLPEGYEPREVDLLIRLPPGFPDVQPDMYWCDPPVRLARTGVYPQAADQFQGFLGRNWQRFSRHLPPGAWHPGRDSLESYITLIRGELARTA
jgi:Prokaryotic E2 family E